MASGNEAETRPSNRRRTSPRSHRTAQIRARRGNLGHVARVRVLCASAPPGHSAASIIPRSVPRGGGGETQGQGARADRGAAECGHLA
jgi:hypothetical protein